MTGMLKPADPNSQLSWDREELVPLSDGVLGADQAVLWETRPSVAGVLAGRLRDIVGACGPAESWGSQRDTTCLK